MWKPFVKSDIDLCLKEPYQYFMVRKLGKHPATGDKFTPSVVQLIDSKLYTSDNECEPIIFSHKDDIFTPCDNPFECDLEWCEIPE